MNIAAAVCFSCCDLIKKAAYRLHHNTKKALQQVAPIRILDNIFFCLKPVQNIGSQNQSEEISEVGKRRDAYLPRTCWCRS